MEHMPKELQAASEISHRAEIKARAAVEKYLRNEIDYIELWRALRNIASRMRAKVARVLKK